MYERGDNGLAKDDAQALYWYRKAADQDDIEIQNDVAWTFATSSDAAIRNPAAALEYAHKAVSSEKDHPDPSHLDTLAEAYYANQQLEEAVKTEHQAIALTSSENIAAFQANLERYQRALQERKNSEK
jgi:TPR repeat protein